MFVPFQYDLRSIFVSLQSSITNSLSRTFYENKLLSNRLQENWHIMYHLCDIRSEVLKSAVQARLTIWENEKLESILPYFRDTGTQQKWSARRSRPQRNGKERVAGPTMWFCCYFGTSVSVWISWRGRKLQVNGNKDLRNVYVNQCVRMNDHFITFQDQYE